MEKKEFNPDQIKVREYSRLNNLHNNLTLIVVVFLMVVAIIQYLNNKSLKNKVSKEVYVAVEDKLYKAFPEVRKRGESDYKIFGEMFGYNAFSHDVNSYKERMDLVRPFTTQGVMDYIEKSFEYKGLSVTDYYRKYDGRSYYKIDSVFVEIGSGEGDIFVYGEQRFMFAIGEPVKGALNFRLQVREIDRSDANKFGLFIDNFLFIR
mgnify:FL=1